MGSRENASFLRRIPSTLKTMRYFLGTLLVIGALGLGAFNFFNVSYWMKKPEVRADAKWALEIEKLNARSPKIKTALLLLKDWQMTTTDQQFKELIDKAHPPFRKVQNGRYFMQLNIMPWMEDMKYGYVIEHEIFDSNKNKAHEFSINIEIGKLW
jgi:hypothetical protein